MNSIPFSRETRLFVLLLVLWCSSVNRLVAQSEKDIVKRYRVALQKVVDETAVRSMKMEAIFGMQKVNFPATFYFRPPCMRMEMRFQNVTFLQISNDSIRWEYNPLTDVNKITRITKGTSSFAGDKSFDYVNQDLLNFESLNHQLKLKGLERVDSMDVYVLELTKSDKKNARILLTKNSHLIYKIEDEKGYRYFANYTNQDGFVFPKYIYESNSKHQIELRVSQLTFNGVLNDTLFAIPKSALSNTKTSTQFKNELAIADSLYKAGHHAEAVKYYSAVISEDPQNEYAFNARGLAKIALKEYYEAITDFGKVLELNPKAANARNNIGLAKYYLRDHQGALQDYTRALEIEPTLVVSYKNRGLIYQETEKYELAVNDFSQAMKLSPNDGTIHFRLGVVLAQLNKYDDAIKSYHLARLNNYHGDDLYNYKGVSEYSLERYDSACVSFKKALAMNPTNLQYIENYGRALYELGKYQEASEQFESYLKKQNDNASIYNMNGLCKFNEEDYKGAIQYFTKSIELNGKEATYYDNRATAKENIEDYEGAISDYGESIRVYPNDAAIFYKRGLLKIHTSKKLEGCMDLATANEMKYEPAKEAILQNCH